MAAAIMASLGIVAVLLNSSWADRHSDAVTSFASGMLVTTAIMHLIPESIAISRLGMLFVLAGYLVLSASDWLLDRSTSFGGDRRVAAAIPIIGVGFHSFVDGLEYPILFAHEFFTGLIATAGLIVHEFAEGVIVFAILRTSGRRALTSAVGALFLAAATTPLGAIVAADFLGSLGEKTIGQLLGLAAGALLFVGANHLPQQLRSRGKAPHFPAFFLAVTIAASLSLTHMAGEDLTH